MRIFGREPAVWLYMINAGVALLVSFGLALTDVQTAAITTIATAVFTIYTAVVTRPIKVSALTGAVASGLTAATAFGLGWTGEQIGALVASLSVVLALVLRQNVSPVEPARGEPLRM